METKVGNWYYCATSKSRRYFPVKVLEIYQSDGEEWVRYADMGAYDGLHIFESSLLNFETHFEEYDIANIAEDYDGQTLFDIIDKISIQYLRGLDVVAEATEQAKDLNKDIAKMNRRIKILNVLAANKKQKMWKEGELIPGRVAECSDCSKMELSETTLPFFKQRPDWDTDRYYCGCRGWD